MSTFPMKDMANTYIEHSMVINNFVTTVGNQLKSSVCRVFVMVLNTNGLKAVTNL